MMAGKAPKLSNDSFVVNLRKVQSLPESYCADLTNSPEWQTIKEKFVRLISADNFRMYRDDVKETFDIDIDNKNKTVNWHGQTDRQICDYFVTYYGMCITLAGNQGEKQYVTALGESVFSFVKSVSDKIQFVAGVSSRPSTTESQKDSAQKKAERAERMKNHPTGELPDSVKAALTVAQSSNSVPSSEPVLDPEDRDQASGTQEGDADSLPTILLPDSADDCTEIIPRKYILDGVIEDASVVMFAGKEKIGKSYVAMNLALHMATERPWMGRATMQDAHGGILWVNLDMKRETARRRINEISNGIEEAWNVRHPNLFSNFFMLHSQTFREHGLDSLTFDGKNEKAVDEMEKLIKDPRYNVKVCFIDAQVQVEGSLDENVSGDAEKLFHRMKQIRDDTGCSFILIHHNTKYGDRGRGSSALFGETDLNLQLSEDVNDKTGSTLILKTDGARDNAKSDIGMRKCFVPRIADDGSEMKDVNGHTVWNFRLEPVDAKTIVTSATANVARKEEEKKLRYEKSVLNALDGELFGLTKNEIYKKAHIDKQESNFAVDRLADRGDIVCENGKYRLSGL